MTELDKVLMNDVLITSVSIYPVVCRTAQSSLESAVKGLLKSRSHIVDWIVSDILESIEKTSCNVLKVVWVFWHSGFCNPISKDV